MECHTRGEPSPVDALPPSPPAQASPCPAPPPSLCNVFQQWTSPLVSAYPSTRRPRCGTMGALIVRRAL